MGGWGLPGMMQYTTAVLTKSMKWQISAVRRPSARGDSSAVSWSAVAEPAHSMACCWVMGM